jgi:small subunit ribosomal protein S6
LRTYEALFIVRPDLKDEEVQAIANEVESSLKDSGGAIVRSEIWGKRRLAYEVKSFNEGNYILIRFQADKDFPAKLEGYFRLSEPVIRWLVTQFDEKTLRLEAEQQRRTEADIARGAGRRGPDDDDDRPRGRHSDDRDDRPSRPARPARPAEPAPAPAETPAPAAPAEPSAAASEAPVEPAEPAASASDAPAATSDPA